MSDAPASTPEPARPSIRTRRASISSPVARAVVTPERARAYVEAALAAHPQLAQLGPSFGLHLETFEAAPDLTSRAGDLLIAHGAAVGDAAALALFVPLLRAQTTLAHARLHSRLPLDEAVRRVQEHLAPATHAEHPAAVAAYRGDASLEAFVRVVATRLLLEVYPRTPEEAQLEEGVLRGPKHRNRDLRANPELLALRRRRGDAFHTAFAEAEAALEARPRAILRFALCEELTAEEIGLVYGVHHATVARWLAEASETLASQLLSRLELDAKERVAVEAALDKQLEASLSRVLDPTLGEDLGEDEPAADEPADDDAPPSSGP